jgi:hypothetical protein
MSDDDRTRLGGDRPPTHAGVEDRRISSPSRSKSPSSSGIASPTDGRPAVMDLDAKTAPDTSRSRTSNSGKVQPMADFLDFLMAMLTASGLSEFLGSSDPSELSVKLGGRAPARGWG